MFGRKRAIKKYIKLLPNSLLKRYGKRDSYTVGQIEATVKELKLSLKYIDYAYIIFCQRQTDDESGEVRNKIDIIRKILGRGGDSGLWAEEGPIPIFKIDYDSDLGSNSSAVESGGDD